MGSIKNYFLNNKYFIIYALSLLCFFFSFYIFHLLYQEYLFKIYFNQVLYKTQLIQKTGVTSENLLLVIRLNFFNIEFQDSLGWLYIKMYGEMLPVVMPDSFFKQFIQFIDKYGDNIEIILITILSAQLGISCYWYFNIAEFPEENRALFGRRLFKPMRWLNLFGPWRALGNGDQHVQWGPVEIVPCPSIWTHFYTYIQSGLTYISSFF